MKHSSFDATISALDAETSALGVVTSAIARSYQRFRRGVSDNIGDCGVGVTPRMCNRVTNHGDRSTFSKPACDDISAQCSNISAHRGNIGARCGIYGNISVIAVLV